MGNLTDHPYTLKRRKFIRWLAMGAAAIGAPALVFNYSNLLKTDAAGPEDELIELCGNKALLTIGKQWIEKHPAEKNAAALKAKLLEGSRLPRYDTASPRQLISFIRSKSQSEFARFDTVIADGWVLTETDCRVAALYFLNHPQTP